MTNYTLDYFWKNRLPQHRPLVSSPLRGWHYAPSGLATFREAPLTESDGLGAEGDASTSAIILVSAPGAVGKSTLARQIAALTGAIYVDLAEAEPVGGNTLSGGLFRSGISNEWQTGNAAVLIDGLDEARLRVTQEAFEAFLSDVAAMAKDREVPTVLFGRTGAVQDAWLVLTDKLPVAVLEIGYYGPDAASEFAYAHLPKDSPHLAVARKAVDLLLNRLREDTSGDGDRFAGYAPVLQAVAERVAQEGNPSALVSQVEKGEQPVTLQTVVEAILEREHQKLQALVLEDTGLASKLYRPAEQLQRLVARVYRGAMPSLPSMSPKDAQTYAAALDTWVPEHPFLDGSVNAASAVFEAVLAAEALRSRPTADVALTKELAKGATANPFLSEFYFDDEGERFLPPALIGVIYASLRARLSIGDTASLLIDGAEEGDDLETLRAEVEISLFRHDADRTTVLRLDSEQTGTVRLGSHIEDVEVFTPLAKVEIGGASESVLIAPVSVQCGELVLSTERLVVEAASGSAESAVFLEAERSDTGALGTVPTLHGNVTLSVAWPGSANHPWTSFATAPTPHQDPRTEEALRRFRKFVIAFRSHSKGSLKRYGAKIEHERMTKGVGRAVLQHLLNTGILTPDGSMYTLHPDKLAKEAGTSYGPCMARQFSAKAVAFAEAAIAQYA